MGREFRNTEVIDDLVWVKYRDKSPNGVNLKASREKELEIVNETPLERISEMRDCLR